MATLLIRFLTNSKRIEKQITEINEKGERKKMEVSSASHAPCKRYRLVLTLLPLADHHLAVTA
jgi:hypothetical protein